MIADTVQFDVALRAWEISYSPQWFDVESEIIVDFPKCKLRARKVGCTYKFALAFKGTIFYEERGRAKPTPHGTRITPTSELEATRINPTT